MFYAHTKQFKKPGVSKWERKLDFPKTDYYYNGSSKGGELVMKIDTNDGSGKLWLSSKSDYFLVADNLFDFFQIEGKSASSGEGENCDESDLTFCCSVYGTTKRNRTGLGGGVSILEFRKVE